MLWACQELGSELAILILNKAIKDYWNEVKVIGCIVTDPNLLTSLPTGREREGR